MANKQYSFMFQDIDGTLDHIRPDEVPCQNDPVKIFTELPWETSPEWLVALEKSI